MNTIEFRNGSLSIVNSYDRNFIHELFRDSEVRRFYVLRDDHASNIDAFVDYIIDSIHRQVGLDFIINSEYTEKVGLITAELVRNNNTGDLMWNVGYAVLPEFRNLGYASNALNALTNYLLNSFSVQLVSLDICAENKLSEKVATKCGFKKPETGEKIGYFDLEHMDLVVRFKWYKSISSKRVTYFNQASQAYRMKDYNSSIKLYQSALSEEYPQGTPYTDAQIYANMAMAYSSIYDYETDYKLLMKAKRLGLTNASIEKELTWLRTNCGF